MKKAPLQIVALSTLIFLFCLSVLWGAEVPPGPKVIKPDQPYGELSEEIVRSMAIPLFSTNGIPGIGCDDMTWISTRTSHTLHHTNHFVSRDCDLSFIDPSDSWAMKVLAGNRIDLLSLDAADVFILGPDIVDEIDELEGLVTDDEIYLMLLSVRESQSLTQYDGSTFYAKQQDVVFMIAFSTPTYFGAFFLIAFPGSYHNCPGIDGVSYLGGSTILISPTEDWYCDVGCSPPQYFKDHDIVAYDFLTGSIDLFLRGSEMGICSLDGLDFVLCTDYNGGDEVELKIYFSVKKPEYILQPGNPIYLEDGDIGCYDLLTGELEVFLYGQEHYIHDIDALSVGSLLPFRAFMAGGLQRIQPGNSAKPPKSLN